MASTSNKVEKARINTYLPNKLVDMLDDEAVRLGMSRSNVLCLCIDTYFRMKDQEKVVNTGVDMAKQMGMDEFIKVFTQKMR